MFDDPIQGHFPHFDFQPFSQFSAFSTFCHDVQHCDERASFHERFDAFMEHAFGGDLSSVGQQDHGEQCGQPLDDVPQATEPTSLPEIGALPAVDAATHAAPPDTSVAQNAIDDLVNSLAIKL